MIVLSATAAVIVFGVFFVPVLLPLVMKNKIAIDFKFYNQALIPVMLVTVVLMALTPLMPWRKAREENRPLKALDKTILTLCTLVTVFFVVGAARAAMGGFRNHNPGEPFLTAPNDWAYLAFMLLIGVAMGPTVVCGWRSRRGGARDRPRLRAHR